MTTPIRRKFDGEIATRVEMDFEKLLARIQNVPEVLHFFHVVVLNLLVDALCVNYFLNISVPRRDASSGNTYLAILSRRALGIIDGRKEGREEEKKDNIMIFLRR